MSASLPQTAPSFSVVVRTRDRPWFLTRALRSILAQTLPASDIVVVNDGGAPPAPDTLFPTRNADCPGIKVLNHATPHGRAAAWNAGIRASRGDWVATLDDDDTWHPDFIAAVAEVVRTQPNISEQLFGVVALSTLVTEIATSDGWKETGEQQFNAGLKRLRHRDLVLANRFTNNAFVFPRAACDVIGYIREDLPVLEDWEFNVRFAARFPLILLPRLLVRYHRRCCATGTEQNSAQPEHDLIRKQLSLEWWHNDRSTGRYVVGLLTRFSSMEGRRGLRVFERLASRLGS